MFTILSMLIEEKVTFSELVDYDLLRKFYKHYDMHEKISTKCQCIFIVAVHDFIMFVSVYNNLNNK